MTFLWAEDMGREEVLKYPLGIVACGGGASEKAELRVVNTLMLCYTYVLCLRVKISINT